MQQGVESADVVRFGTYEANLKTRELRRAGAKVRIQAQPFKVLEVLLEQPGEVVSREEIQRRLWGTDTTVDFDHSLGIAINKLREALGDSAENPRFVETLARRGYRFIAPLTVEVPLRPSSSDALLPDEVAKEAPRPNRRRRFLLWTGVILGAALTGAVIAAHLLPARTAARRVTQITYSGRVLEPSIDVDGISSSASDGARLYFSHTEAGRIALAQALIANGEISEIKLPSDIASPIIASLSPDGAKLIVHKLVSSPEQPFWIVPTLGGDAQRVPGIEGHDAAWMPDGKRIVFAHDNAIFSAQSDGSDVRKIADVPGWAFWLRWSPDGTRLRFSLRDADHQTSALWEIGAQGGGPHALLAGWSQPASECCGSWTADGKYYVFQSRHSGHSDLWVRDEGAFASHAPRQLTNGPLDYEAPITGQQGHTAFFIGANPQIQLLRFDPTMKRFARMGGPLGSAALTAYSRDGQWVAWLNMRDGSLWRSRLDGSDRLELDTPPLRIFMMRWSPDSRQLAIMAEEPGNPWKIYLQDASGGKLEPLLQDNRNEADPDWSSDGKSLVFGRLPEQMSSEQQPRALYFVDLHSRTATEIPGSTGLFSPRLSPDSRYIAAIGLTLRSLSIFDREKNSWRTLATQAVADPQWSHDSKAIYFQDNREEGKPIYRIDVQTGRLQKIATLDDLRPLAALDYRLITLAPGDLPVVSASTSNVNLYSTNLDR